MTHSAARPLSRFMMLILTAFVATLYGCGNGDTQAPAGAKSSSAAPSVLKKMTIDVTGDLNLHYEATGEDVAVGFLPGKEPGANWLTLSGNQDKDGDSNSVSIGPILGFSFDNPSQKHIELLFQGGRVEVTHGESNASYDTGAYYLYFDKDKTGANSNVKLDFSRVEKLHSSNKLLMRYRMVGTFQFNAAFGPEQPNEACSKEAATYAAEHGERHPGFDAKLCEAKSVVAKGTFDLTQDFPVRGEAG
ncbi:hypothetical protein [Pseudomonas huanghezhanensis]|uniref:hypothetical protein n=1 Tax=Pseudomonas huanghezhanensis TaxID=3002903 RepID=UPI002285D0BC|nr:hypothetical protein [Pseudomonas sp. BSw22131]